MLALDRMGRRQLEHPRRHARDGAGLRHRCDHPAQRRPTSSTTTSSRSGSRPSPAPRCSTTAGTATRTLLLVRGVEAGYGERPVLRDVNLELHEGEIVALLGTNGAGQVDAAEGDQRRGRGRPRRHRARRPRHHPRPAERDRRARHRADARRQGRVRLADGPGEPRTRRMDQPPRSGRCQGGHRRGASRRSRSSANDSTLPPPTCPAGSSRCSRWR